MKLPDKIFGISTEEAYKRYLEESKKPDNEPEKPATPAPSVNIQNPGSYVILPSRTHGNYSYPDLLVAMEKSHFNDNWNQAHESLHQENSFMLNIRQYVDFLNLLKSGNAYDGKGNKVDKSRLDAILDEILTVRTPYRSEWLDADFKVINDKLHINYNHRNINSELKPQNSEPLMDCLMEDKTPGIDLDYWLKNATSQGLPPKDIPKGNIWYWYPRSDNNSVARFYADSVRVFLSCYRVPRFSNFALGVRVAREK